MPHGERGVQRAGPRLNRAFLAALVLREENALLSYGFSLCKKPAGCVRLHSDAFPLFLARLLHPLYLLCLPYRVRLL